MHYKSQVRVTSERMAFSEWSTFSYLSLPNEHQDWSGLPDTRNNRPTMIVVLYVSNKAEHTHKECFIELTRPVQTAT